MRQPRTIAGGFLAALAAALLGGHPVAASTLVVGNKGDDTVSLIDYDTGREIARIPTGPKPHEVTLSPDGRLAAVVAYGGHTIDIIDIPRARSIETVRLPHGAHPHGISWLADGRMVVTAEGIGALVTLSPDRKRQGVIPLGRLRPHMVVTTANGQRAFVSNVNSGIVSVVDLETGRVVAELEAGRAPEGICLSPDDSRLWVAERDGNRIRLFDTATLKEIAALDVGTRPIRMMVTPDGRRAISANFVDGTLTEIHAHDPAVRATIPVAEGQGANLVTVIASPKDNHVLVAETGKHRIAEVDLETGRVTRRIAAGRHGDGLAVSPVKLLRSPDDQTSD